jgi:hypothetical protein
VDTIEESRAGPHESPDLGSSWYDRTEMVRRDRGAQGPRCPGTKTPSSLRPLPFPLVLQLNSSCRRCCKLQRELVCSTFSCAHAASAPSSPSHSRPRHRNSIPPLPLSLCVLLVCPRSGAMAAYLGNKLVQMGTKIVGVGRNYAAHAKELGSAIPKVPYPCSSSSSS